MSFILAKQEETNCDFAMYCNTHQLDPAKVALIIPKNQDMFEIEHQIKIRVSLDNTNPERTLLKLWQAIGQGLHLLLPVRAQFNQLYFDDHFSLDNNPYEPDFWLIDDAPNKAIAAIYMAEFKCMLEWFADSSKHGKAFFMERFPPNAAQARWCAFNKNSMNQSLKRDVNRQAAKNHSLHYTSCILLALGMGLIAASLTTGLLFAFPPAGLGFAAMAGIVAGVTLAAALLGGLSGYVMEKKQMKRAKEMKPVVTSPESEQDNKIWTLDMNSDEVHYSNPVYPKKIKKSVQKTEQCNVSCQLL